MRKARNDATTRGLWAPIVDNGHSRWIVYTAIRATKRDAKAAFLDDYDPLFRMAALKAATFAKVLVAEESPESRTGEGHE